MIDRRDPPEPRLWAIGGGKGGVGKSVIAANLAVALASAREQVALVDLDLGGANLHTLLGMRAPDHSLADFLSRRLTTLAEAMAPTPHHSLALISGAGPRLDMANPKHTQKVKLLRHLQTLPVDHVVLDLGAGSSFNVLDFFLAAHLGVLVLVPEPTSVENAYHVLRAALHRRLVATEPRDRVRALLERLEEEVGAAALRSPRHLVARAMLEDRPIGEALAASAESFSPAVLVNCVETDVHRRLGRDVCTACREYFGMAISHLGNIERDPLVARSIALRRPAVEIDRQAPFSVGVLAVAEGLRRR